MFKSKKIKVVLVLVVLAVCFSFLMPSLVDAKVDLNTPLKEATQGAYGDEVTKAPSFPLQVGKIIKVVLTVLGVILIVVIVYAGFLWMMAGGNDEQVTKARKWITNGIIGLVIILLAFALTEYVVLKLTVQTGVTGVLSETLEVGEGIYGEGRSAMSALPTLIGNIIKIVLSTLGVVLVCIIVYAGYLWMTAGGNAEQTKKARAWITNAIIGLIIAISAYAITDYVVSNLIVASEGPTAPTAPTTENGGGVALHRLILLVIRLLFRKLIINI